MYMYVNFDAYIVYIYVHVNVCTYVSMYICTHAYVVRRLAVPAPPPPPPPWYGLVGVGGGAAGMRAGPVGAATGCCGGRPGLTRKPLASRKPYNVARAPVLINLNLYFKPYTQP